MGLWNDRWVKNLPIMAYVHLPLGGKPQASYKPKLPTKKIRYLEQKKDTNINRHLDPKDSVSKDATSLY